MNQNPFRKILGSIARIGVEVDDTPETRLKKALLSVSIFIYSLVFITILGPVYFYFRESVVALMYFGFALFSLAGLGFVAVKPGVFPVFRFLIFSVGLAAEFTATLLLGGFVNSSGLIMWGLLTVQGSLVHFGPRRSLYWFLAYIVLLVLLVILHPFLRSTNNVPHVFVLVLFIFNLVLVSGGTFLSLNQNIKQRDMAFSLLREERQKSENLLLNILPREIAGILKSGRSTIADHYENASILFADLVNFTSLSERMTPAQLVELLNEVFSHFDTLAEKYGLEKIKTIGDCYMVAAGVPVSRPDHAQALTRMALEMRDYMSRNQFAGLGLIFRTGIHSGAVVAGVIGKKKFIYDLWGDAVNTASRMESHGAAGAIQITEATYALIKDEFICEARGKIHVKGKGEMEVWHVIGERRI